MCVAVVAAGQALIHVAAGRAVDAFPPVRTNACERTDCIAADRVVIAVMAVALTLVDVAARGPIAAEPNVAAALERSGAIHAPCTDSAAVMPVDTLVDVHARRGVGSTEPSATLTNE